MLTKLNAFYESHGISPVGFRCSSRSSCSANSAALHGGQGELRGSRAMKGENFPACCSSRWTRVAAVQIRSNARPKPSAVES